MRKKAAKKLNNTELLKISLYSQRHCRATKERHAKGNPDPVQYLLGHSSLTYVQIYTHWQSNALTIWKYTVFEARTSEQRREEIQKVFKFVEKDSERVSWYLSQRRSSTDGKPK